LRLNKVIILKDIKNFYSTFKAVYSPITTSSSPPLLSADGNTLIAVKEKILERWAEHFASILNRPSNINEEAIFFIDNTKLHLQIKVFYKKEKCTTDKKKSVSH